MAEALGKKFGSDKYEFYSAGTETKQEINLDAVRLIKEVYEIPEVDIVITMGCNVQCPIIPYEYTEDWGLEDPTGKSDEEFLKIIKIMKTR